MDEARKELKALKAGTNVSTRDVSQIVTISTPNVCTEAEADALLNGKASSTYAYSKAEADAKLDTTVYTGDLTAVLTLKANTADVYVKSEVDTILACKSEQIWSKFPGVFKSQLVW